MTRSLVKVYATKRLPDLARPWSKQPSAEVTGSGMVIAGRRILTSNHVVSYASTVLVQPEGSSEKLRARVVAADLGIDLALLEPEDTSLFAAYPPIAISDDLPDVGQWDPSPEEEGALRDRLLAAGAARAGAPMAVEA